MTNTLLAKSTVRNTGTVEIWEIATDTRNRSFEVAKTVKTPMSGVNVAWLFDNLEAAMERYAEWTTDLIQLKQMMRSVY